MRWIVLLCCPCSPPIFSYIRARINVAELLMCRVCTTNVSTHLPLTYAAESLYTQRNAGSNGENQNNLVKRWWVFGRFDTFGPTVFISFCTSALRHFSAFGTQLSTASVLSLPREHRSRPAGSLTRCWCMVAYLSCVCDIGHAYLCLFALFFFRCDSRNRISCAARIMRSQFSSIEISHTCISLPRASNCPAHCKLASIMSVSDIPT